MSLLTMLPDLGTLQRLVSSKDTSGGETDQWIDVDGATDMPGALQPMSAQFRKQYRILMPAQAWTWYTSQEIGPFITTTVGALPKHRFVMGTGASQRLFKIKGFAKAPPSAAMLEWPAEMHLEEQAGA